MADTGKGIKLILVLFALLLLTAILGISIAVLVETSSILSNQNNQIKNQQNNPPQPPVTQPPVTPAPVTQPVVTQPVVTQPPVTQPPVTQPPVTQPPVTQPPATNLNINGPVAAQPGTSQYSNYQSVIQLLKLGLNTNVSPCDDFYTYTCGAYTPDMDISFGVSDDDNSYKMAQQLMDSAYIAKSPSPVKQIATYFNACRAALADWTNTVQNGKIVTDAVQALMNGEDGLATTSTFPMFDQKTNYDKVPDNYTMGWLLGYPTGQYGAATLVSSYVDTNWKDPHGTGFAYYIDQPNTLLPNTYYIKDWKNAQVSLQVTIMKNMNKYALAKGVTLDQNKLQQDTSDIIALDYMLATKFSTDDTTRRQYDRSYNPTNINTLLAQYPTINWHVYVPETTLTAPKAMSTILAPGYNFILMEPAQLAKMNQLLTDPISFGVKPNTIVNYIYYNLVYSLQTFLPSLPQTAEHELHRKYILDAMYAKKHAGKRRSTVIPRKRRYDHVLMANPDDIATSCAAETVDVLMYANARIFIDKIYPTPGSRDDIRNNVAKVASSILIGFRSMIDQLSWMTPSSKKGAYNKIENLVKNIAYPDFVADDAQLTAYHQTLGIVDGDNYTTCWTKANQFNLYQAWMPLAKTGGAARTDFNGPPGTTNAWYQPELNSISFPAAILRQPFYDPGWPAAVNFGAMGVIAGHELTHGFDDEGVQWDGTGVLSGWMDATSKLSFTDMANCVVQEYSGFCPLNKTVYGGGACVDGAQTQGENIADNGGIHSAFRAYKNYINLNGPDPALPDGLMSGFTADQLFFLGFAQVWCQFPPTDAQMERQILVDVHSPSVYRVFGTIQNFPAFKDAFHCPTTAAYAPDNHCDVWVSEIDSTYGQPVVPVNDINVAVNPQAVPSNLDQYNAFNQALAYYQKSVNFTADPCNDFWTYSCGNYDQAVSFHFADANNLVTMVNKFTSPDYQDTIKGSSALTKEKQFFDACVKLSSDKTANNNTLVQKNYLKTKMDDLKVKIGSSWQLVTNDPATKPSATQLANALAYLSFTQGIDTFITPMVDTNWDDNTKGYRMFIDQNTAEMSKTYYAPDAFKTVKDNYITSTTQTIQQYCIEQGIPQPADLKTRVANLIAFEQVLAYQYSTDDSTRRQYKRSNNPMTSAQLNTAYPFVDWPTYVQQIPASADIVKSAGYNFIAMEQDMFKKLNDDYMAAAPVDMTPQNIVNYLYMRLLLDNAQYLPSYKSIERVDLEETFHLGLERSRKLPRRRLADVTDAQSSCMSMANGLMQFSTGRIFIDNQYPTAQSRLDIRANVGGLAKNVINSFQGMLEQLDWMADSDKSNALTKTTNLVKNIAFPDFIANDTTLDAYYSTLTFDATDNYYDMWDKLIKFNIYLQYNQLSFAQTDRHDFLGQPATVNAWYQPELNSITFPAGILVPPYFHPQWPASLNYGGLGVVSGHELTHGFDDEGVQWDGTGDLKTWMNDPGSKTGFQNMADCVIQEYGQFCPLDANQYTPNCVNGNQTQGENIADNGGIHAAFRAYRVHTQLNGPDPQLPDKTFSQFTHDQLFFLSFGQVWCEAARSPANQYKQLMVDPHSPSQYRVFGTIQNYPAFRTAFNCPANSAYAPNQHCKVWVPNVEA